MGKIIASEGFPNYSELHVTSPAGAEAYRKKAYRLIWGQDTLPTFTATFNTPYYDYTFPQPHATPQLFRMLSDPSGSPNGKAVIYHNEHNVNTQSANDYNAVATELKALGYDLYEIRSWGNTPNTGPIPGGIGGHGNGALAFGLVAMQIHINQILALVNTIAANYSSIAMMGKSAGGWATSLYAGLDPRIKKSFPICGQAPNFIRRRYAGSTPDTDYGGDQEQNWGELFGEVSWLDLYASAAVNGSHQFFSDNDNCCFGGSVEQQTNAAGLTYGQYVNAVMSPFGGEFTVTTVTAAQGASAAHYCLKDTATPTTRMAAVWDSIILPTLASMA
jgi:hypothetical protein